MAQIDPTYLVDKYLKSASLGQTYTERSKIILAAFIFPIWLFAFGLCILSIVNGIKGIYYYNDAKALLKDIPFLTKNRELYYTPNTSGEDRQYGGLNSEPYNRVGISGPIDPWDNYAPLAAVKLQEERMFSFIYVPIIIFIFFLLPWSLLRFFYLIKKTDHKEKI